MSQINAKFEVTDWKEEQFDERGDAPKVTAASVKKSYSGDIEGDSVTEWLMSYADDGSATFVGLERINGTIDGRNGTLVLQHVGTFKDGAAIAALTAVAGGGSGKLSGATGGGDFRADPSGQVHLDLAFA
jgi:Protein of unknown function (DUF3224)